MDKKTRSDTREVIKIMNKILKPENFFLKLSEDLEYKYMFIDLNWRLQANDIRRVKSFYVSDRVNVFESMFSSHCSSSVPGYTIPELLKKRREWSGSGINCFCDACEKLGIFSLVDVSSLEELKLKAMLL